MMADDNVETKKEVETSNQTPNKEVVERPANVMQPNNVMEGETKYPIQEKMLIITENGIRTNGFNNIYELLGFIDIHVNPERIKALIFEKLK